MSRLTRMFLITVILCGASVVIGAQAPSPTPFPKPPAHGCCQRDLLQALQEIKKALITQTGPLGRQKALQIATLYSSCPVQPPCTGDIQ